MPTNLSVRLTPSADADIRTVARYYAKEAAGFDVRFRRAVADGLIAIAALPESFPKVRGELRRKVLRKFPYNIFFRIVNGEVRVVAICHQRRDPKVWWRRAND